MRFSVVIPLYNKAPYVRKALESVFAQTFRDFELIVVDDGSKDESYDVAKSVLERCDVPYLLIHQENAGVSTARNNGVTASRGDYLCFLDADDWWAPEFLGKMDKLIRDYPDAGIYGTNYYYVKNGRQRVCVSNIVTGFFNYYTKYAETLVMPLTSSSVSIPRNVFEEMKGFHHYLRFGEDFDLWIRIVLKYRVVFWDEPLAFYFQDSDPTWRGIGHLVDPKFHMLWNLDYLIEQEEINVDYKHLVDTLRINGLFAYYLSNQYHALALQELNKVDWSKQPFRNRLRYRIPIPISRCQRALLKHGARIKQWLIKHL